MPKNVVFRFIRGRVIPIVKKAGKYAAGEKRSARVAKRAQGRANDMAILREQWRMQKTNSGVLYAKSKGRSIKAQSRALDKRVKTAGAQSMRAQELHAKAYRRKSMVIGATTAATGTSIVAASMIVGRKKKGRR